MTFNVNTLRKDFPILSQRVRGGQPLVYLDNAATTQKPHAVINAISEYYRMNNANVHRGIHCLGERATAAYEGARETVSRFLQAKHSDEIVFTRGTTESINLVAHCFEKAVLQAGDEVLISMMEHHANIVPWQQACAATGATLKVIPITEAGELDYDVFADMLNEKTKLLALTHVSNTLGTINDVKMCIDKAKEKNIPVLLDGAQAAPHMAINVQDLDCDFYVFSGHKIFGPTGIGVLYAKSDWLDRLPPYQTGGSMIETVSFEETTFAKAPHKFEAGTPNIADAVGLAAAIDYLQTLDWTLVRAYESGLANYLHTQLRQVYKLNLLGDAKNKVGVASFVFDEIHAHDVGAILDDAGIAVRVGHHCTMPLMQFYDVPATVRASVCFYNTMEEVDALVDGLEKVKKVFK
ncbi:MAG: cysteine desulfurase [marine bacterium B5-7]|nr:MAG: cysteine desulfurase [marine bacterium B5-7]